MCSLLRDMEIVIPILMLYFCVMMVRGVPELQDEQGVVFYRVGMNKRLYF